MADPLRDLAKWMSPFTVTMNAESLAERRQVVEGIAAATEIDADALVAAAHGHFSENSIDSLSSVVQTIDPSILLAEKPDFAAALCGAAVAKRLDIEGDDRDSVVMNALLVLNARYLRLTPSIASLAQLATAALVDSGRRVREPLEPTDTPKEVRGLLGGATRVAADASDLSEVLKAVKSRDAALNALARRVEGLVPLLEDRLELVEEELDLLWWGRRGTSGVEDIPWEAIEPAQRACVAASEVAARITRLPAPPLARALLRQALGQEADAEFTIAAVASHMPAEGLSTQKRLLMPLSTFRAIAESVGNDQQSIAAAIVRTAPDLPATEERPLIETAEQALRELQINKLT